MRMKTTFGKWTGRRATRTLSLRGTGDLVDDTTERNAAPHVCCDLEAEEDREPMRSTYGVISGAILGIILWIVILAYLLIF